ncbi:replication protein A 70 [Lycorma delicatula]|uniref:replication protein A 70 n=1 Tax=Lycorma delicatula TaxID=130591 RepID=UPI003F512517
MPTPALTEGAIQTIMSGGEVMSPVLQILGNKKITGSGPSDRYRLLISDGVHLNSFAMLATQLNDKVESGELTEYSIVRINRHIVSMVNNQGRGEKRVMIILDLTVLQRGNEVGLSIGNPVPYDSSNPTPAPATTNVTAPQVRPNSTPANSPTPFGGKPGNNPSVGSSPLSSQRTHPIAYLSPYQNKWVIKARVTSKTNIRTWSNARGEGKLFSVDLVDESGEIRLTFFRDQVDQFYDMIEQNKVYYFSRCQLKQANKKFSSLNNDYEMTANSDTKIEPCNEDSNGIPTLKFNFTTLSSIQDLPADSIIDIIGVCKSAGDLVNLVGKTSNRELKKRDLVLVDHSLTSVTLTMWGVDAENFDGVAQPVIALKQGRISEFGGGKTVNLMSSSVLQINPDIPEAHKLRGWFDGLSLDAQFNSLSARGGASEGVGSKFVTIKESKLSPPATEKPEYFSICAYVMHIRNDNYCYKACPQPECNKKVIDQNTMMYRCEKCNREYDSFKYRLILSLQLADMSDSQWVTAFQDSAEILLGGTADEIGSLTDAAAIEELFQAPLFKPYNLRLRSKMETFNDELRRKVHIVSLKPMDYKEYGNRLISEIKQLAGVSMKTEV